jgi:hypothetical protein
MFYFPLLLKKNRDNLMENPKKRLLVEWAETLGVVQG